MMQAKVFERDESFCTQRFLEPWAIDRGAPFWSWNGKLDQGRLDRQLEVFKTMGLGGAHLHPRTGLATPYLGDEFMDRVEDSHSKAEELGMLTWLYDEDRWPSGFAGGLAVKDRKHWIRHLRITRQRVAPGTPLPMPVHHGPPSSAKTVAGGLLGPSPLRMVCWQGCVASNPMTSNPKVVRFSCTLT